REMESWEIRSALGGNRWERLLNEPSQPRRYQMLAEDVVQFVRDNPAQTIKNRVNAGLYFFFGWDWFHDNSPLFFDIDQAAAGENTDSQSAMPLWLRRFYPVIISGALLLMLLLAVLGWRWTYGWRRRTGLATLAMLWVPLPYLLTHAESLWGPR